jgi:proteasome lid subunit RPN8/RPN11
MKKINWHDGPVYRTRPLPQGDLRGVFFITEPLIRSTRDALTSFAVAGIRDGGHEGMAFWAGREQDGTRYLLQVIVPDADHSEGRVMASREAVGLAARSARANRLGILCQVHSHPGSDSRHSDGDDELILLPFEGMLSVVVPNFSFAFQSMDDASVHQFQDGRWVLCSKASVAANLILIPSWVDLRA